jgi:restriction system protein
MGDGTAGSSVQYQTPTHDYLRQRLQQMAPEAFEEFVSDVWEFLGWNTRVVGKPGDRGIDVVAVTGDQKQLIQAKRYGPSTSVGSPEVQQYASLRLQEENVDQVTIVTTGTFSRQARELAPELEVLLVNGEELIEMIDEIEAFEVFDDHFADIELSRNVDVGAIESPSRFRQLLRWVRSLFS